MIHCITYDNLDKYAKLFSSQFRLRHEAFIERQGYDVKTYQGMEYDQYDTPSTVYLVYADGDTALGLSRFIPTTQACMLADLWPTLVRDKSLLRDEAVWESTRFAIKKDLPSDLRRRICYELCAAHIEFGLARGIRMIIGLMPTLILRSVYERSGIRLERLGEVYQIGEHARVQAAGIPVNPEQALCVWRKTGVSDVLLKSDLGAEFYERKEKEENDGYGRYAA